MTLAYAPGPYTRKRSTNRAQVISSAAGRPIAFVNGSSPAEAEATAALFAGSARLYEAARGLLRLAEEKFTGELELGDLAAAVLAIDGAQLRADVFVEGVELR